MSETCPECGRKDYHEEGCSFVAIRFELSCVCDCHSFDIVLCCAQCQHNHNIQTPEELKKFLGEEL